MSDQRHIMIKSLNEKKTRLNPLNSKTLKCGTSELTYKASPTALQNPPVQKPPLTKIWGRRNMTRHIWRSL